MLRIDDYAYSSKLIQEAPESKLLFGAAPLLFCLIADSLLADIVTLFLMAYLSLRFTKITIRSYLKLMMIPFSFLLVGTLTIMISCFPIEQNILIGIQWGKHVWGIDTVSLLYGIRLIFRAWAAVGCMYFISLNTTTHDILNFLHRIKCPEILISLMELIYRYIFVLLDEAAKIKIAQSSRLGYRGFRSSIHSSGKLFASLFVRTFLRCDRIYSALESRGYQGLIQTLPKQYDKRNRWLFATMILILFLIAVTLLERRFFLF